MIAVADAPHYRCNADAFWRGPSLQRGGKTVAGKLDLKPGGTAHARLHWVHKPVLG